MKQIFVRKDVIESSLDWFNDEAELYQLVIEKKIGSSEVTILKIDVKMIEVDEDVYNELVKSQIKTK